MKRFILSAKSLKYGFFITVSIFYFTNANASLITNDIKDVFCKKSSRQKVGSSFKIFILVIEIFVIETYHIFCANYNSLISCFCILIDLKKKRCALDLKLSFLNAMIKAIDDIK